MTPHQIDLLDSIRLLTRAGAVQTGHSIHYNENTSGAGWQHANVTIHQPGGGIVSMYVSISPDGDDTPPRGGSMYITLPEMQRILTDYVATHRTEKAA